MYFKAHSFFFFFFFVFVFFYFGVLGFPSTFSMMVFMTVAVSNRSSLEPQSCSQSWLHGANVVSVQNCRPYSGACGPVSPWQSTDYQYVTDEGDTGGHAVGSDQSVVRRWSPASGRFHLVDEFQRVNMNRTQMPQPRPPN